MHLGHQSREDEEALLPQLSVEEPIRTRWSSSWRGNFQSFSFRVAIWQCLAFLRPSFLAKRSPTSEASEKSNAPRKPHSTEYLDGVRGVASLIVFILHWAHVPYPSINSGWGFKDNTSFWLLPFIRIIYSGAAMVAVFFVVSGFVLSHRFVQRMHRHEYNDLLSGLTSLTFRRAIRLFLPAFASSTMAFVCAYLGLISVPEKVDGKPFEHSFSSYIEYLDMESNPWDWTMDFSGFYNPQLWSIAVEFRGSMVVFLLIVGLAKTRTAVRLFVQSFLIVHSFIHKRWDLALFIAGMSLAELEVLLKKPNNPSARRVVNVLLVLAMILGLFLCGYPRDHNTKTPGYMWSKYVWPFGAYRRRFWLAIGAMLFVGPVAFLPSVQSIFLTRPARYLGRISFALYLVHGLGNRTIGKWLLDICWDVIGKEGLWPYAISFTIASALYFPLVMWASDVFWRGVDVPSTNFAKWFEKRCAAPESVR
ncbi:acyltransferase family-domain-containing protein [Hypoxylon trugodes]|uniref:acyltransferase family-domain-containing protein n=1 Tax=Hypoxylon trugodes TaxID=326681 RepID=UPI00218DC9CD|nr:acyltransferase family-domain-containing protein [Hypoxylon trugodes]KAI1393177.1 acyltransferase family-domain-containing protein [Hypoxylon trugodes]